MLVNARWKRLVFGAVAALGLGMLIARAPYARDAGDREAAEQLTQRFVAVAPHDPRAAALLVPALQPLRSLDEWVSPVDE